MNAAIQRNVPSLHTTSRYWAS